MSSADSTSSADSSPADSCLADSITSTDSISSTDSFFSADMANQSRESSQPAEPSTTPVNEPRQFVVKVSRLYEPLQFEIDTTIVNADDNRSNRNDDASEQVQYLAPFHESDEWEILLRHQDWLDILHRLKFEESNSKARLAWKGMLSALLSALLLQHIRYQKDFQPTMLWKTRWDMRARNLIDALKISRRPSHGFIPQLLLMVDKIRTIAPSPPTLWIEILGHLCISMAYVVTPAERASWVAKAKDCYQECYDQTDDHRHFSFLEIADPEMSDAERADLCKRLATTYHRINYPTLC